MSLPIVIKDRKTGLTSRVTEYGQLVVAPLSYSEPVEIELGVINQVYNFITPEMGQKIVITDIIMSANKNVSVTDPANIKIYQADSPDSSVIDKGIVSPQLLRGGSFLLTGLNMIVDSGKWVNAYTDDDDILLTIMYYRVPIEVE